MSLKPFAKIAALAAIAGLALTACADDATSQARAEEETCGLLISASTKVNAAASNIRESDAGDSRAAFAVESAALDLRNHSFDRSNEESSGHEGETLQLRTALQVQAQEFEELSEILGNNPAGIGELDRAQLEVDGMGYSDAQATLSAYCSAAFASQQG